jgi:hypothetical protein
MPWRKIRMIFAGWLCRRLGGIVILIGLGLTGCSNDGRVAVSGTVTLDGTPLENAAISFRPTPGHDGLTAGGQVIDGKFEFAAQHGLLPGKYLVNIQAFRPTGRMVKDPQAGKEIAEQQRVPFREMGKLEVVIEPVGPNRFDLHLTRVVR